MPTSPTTVSNARSPGILHTTSPFAAALLMKDKTGRSLSVSSARAALRNGAAGGFIDARNAVSAATIGVGSRRHRHGHAAQRTLYLRRAPVAFHPVRGVAGLGRRHAPFISRTAGLRGGLRRVERTLPAFGRLLSPRFLPAPSLLAAEHDRYRAYAAPIRDVIDYFNRQHTTSAVMMTPTAPSPASRATSTRITGSRSARICASAK